MKLTQLFTSEYNLDKINKNPIVIVIGIIFINIASKYIFGEITPAQEFILTNNYIKFLALVFILFVYTRDIYASFYYSLIALFIFYLFNENFKFNILPNFVKKQALKLATKNIDNEKIQKAEKIIQTVQQVQDKTEEQKEIDDETYNKYEHAKKSEQPV